MEKLMKESFRSSEKESEANQEEIKYIKDRLENIRKRKKEYQEIRAKLLESIY